ncbi:MAG: hypothetical protein KJ042_04345 [Deltaproteobacteria bacterium]|nr:hypothetical protein [Deltaproteobacteria bacterium]
MRPKRPITIIIILLLALGAAWSFVFASPAEAQVARMPRQGGPMAQSVTGFMQLTLGLTALPAFEATADAQKDGVDVQESDVSTHIPGWSALITLVPTWGMNGVEFGAGYEATGGEMKLAVDDGGVVENGDATFTISDFTIRTGYVRYFGDLDWHPYVLGDVAVAWETMRVAADFENAGDEVGDSKLMTGMVGLGFGSVWEISSGVIGFEARVDYCPFPARHDFPSPSGRYDLEVSRPLLVKLGFVLAIGRL